MKVYFRQTGGFAPTFKGVIMDTAAEPGPDSDELERLVGESGILNLSDARCPGAKNVSFYTFDIETGAGKHVVTLDQLSVPDVVKPLLEFLKARSNNLMPE